MGSCYYDKDKDIDILSKKISNEQGCVSYQEHKNRKLIIIIAIIVCNIIIGLIFYLCYKKRKNKSTNFEYSRKISNNNYNNNNNNNYNNNTITISSTGNAKEDTIRISNIQPLV